ncbi:Acetyl-/propionyl-coenzyme A carboxylase alpha chain [Usitatibacter rugosus]|uniref:Acetyl-/propionyl-coenzyme A carboxylase alpha chain n=1 Tax=Usitatibacter rugosus TaxID=2732067 RepID=A0A6M4GZ94_9PROT|nr:acetyl/propionyl/methylcrotonyl-CoA carboxylase subunit alpha [Usitatibacter rugosus]QJR10847.1 Acetyl-/propionyl-coenzyme A carboxylase alpha chain [Usitatibacter rugosus]
MFSKILIANRGEIACRVIRTCRKLSVRTVAVHSDIDAHALHVEMADEAYAIGGPRPADSYLQGDRIIAVAKACGAEAIHPGYGFLSENEDFARAVEKAGLVFIGPTPEAIEQMGLKDRAKAIMEKAGVPVVPGYHGEKQDDAHLAQQAKKVGYPLLIKAIAGGGGKGMRLVNGDAEFAPQLAAARREAKNAFGDDRVLLERFVTGPHHIEFQVFGDTHGHYVHLFERECSIQRRHQKVLEETPSPFLDDAMREKMGEAAVAAARAIKYRGAGTIEFIAGADRQFFFMEMNTRLQVEHPVTEMITGEDLVEWQLRVAAGEPLPLKQSEIQSGGHSIEVRLCAENPANDFLPETGTIGVLRAPHDTAEEGHEHHSHADVRLETGVRQGDEVSVYYDPMIAKLVVWGDDRNEAARRMAQALSETQLLGVKTNLAFLERVVRHPAFLAGDTDTAFIERHRADLLPSASDVPLEATVAAAARVFLDEQQSREGSAPSPWNDTGGWRLNQPALRKMEFRAGADNVITVDAVMKAGYADVTVAGKSHRVVLGPSHHGRLQIGLDDETYFAEVGRLDDRVSAVVPAGRYELELVDPFHYEPADSLPDARLTALMPGRVVKLMAKVGDSVKKGQSLLILEAMKMEHTIVSPRDGVIERVAFQENQLVPADAVLFAFREA